MQKRKILINKSQLADAQALGRYPYHSFPDPPRMKQQTNIIAFLIFRPEDYVVLYCELENNGR